MLTKEQLEANYDNPDPWGYKTCEADRIRKNNILLSLAMHTGVEFNRALDIACGEGWITQDLPAKLIFGIEASEQAQSRWPENIRRIQKTNSSKFDLVLCTGALYADYDWKSIVKLIKLYSSSIILTCNIADRESDEAIAEIKEFATQIDGLYFPYHRPEESYMQCLRVFKRK